MPGLRPGSGSVLRNVQGRNNGLRACDAVVRHEGDRHVWGYVRVVLDDLSNVVDEIDNNLRAYVCGRCLSADEGHTLLEPCTIRWGCALDHQIPVGQLKGIHELPLVLMHALELAVEQRVRICIQPGRENVRNARSNPCIV